MSKTIGVHGRWCAAKKLGLALLPVFVAAALTMSLMFTGWVAREMHGLSLDVAVIKSTRFTDRNGEELWRVMSQKEPPDWLRRGLDGLDRRLERLEAMLATHMVRHADGRTE